MKLKRFIYENHSPNTAKNYLFEINHFLVANPKARFYKHSDIVKWVESLIDKYPAVNTRIRMLCAVKRYYDYLLFIGKRNDQPCKSLRIRRRRTQIQTQDLFTPIELQLLMNRPNRYRHLDSRNKIIISLLIIQGLSSEELTDLNISNVDFDSGTINIKATRTISGRELELSKYQITLLENYIFNTRPQLIKVKTNRLILNKLGKPISIEGIFAVIETMKAIFPDKILNPERIRMSMISHWLNDRRLPVEEVMDLSGLKWPSSVLMYRRIDIDAQREIINKLHPLS